MEAPILSPDFNAPHAIAVAIFCVQGGEKELHFSSSTLIAHQEELVLPVEVPHLLDAVVLVISFLVNFEEILRVVGEKITVVFFSHEIFDEKSVHILMFSEVNI